MTRDLFDQQLDELRDQVMLIGSLVEEKLQSAVQALATLSVSLAGQVPAMDQAVNQTRFAIEEMCFTVIATQQPAARPSSDLHCGHDDRRSRAHGRPGKRHRQADAQPRGRTQTAGPFEIEQMGSLVRDIYSEALRAHVDRNVALAEETMRRDREVDALYTTVFAKVMLMMVQAGNPDTARSAHSILRVGRELERFGDLATNVAERCVYLVTGIMPWPQAGYLDSGTAF